MDKPKVALTELFYNDGTPFVPSEKEQQVVAETVVLFRQAQGNRDRNFQYFDGLNLIEYIDDSVRRFNTNVDERDGIEDWQAGVHDPFTRNKVLAILGRVLEVLPIASFTGRGTEDTQKGIILTDIYNYVEDMDDYEELMTHVLLEAIVKGTAIGYEDVEYEERKVRDVNGIGDDITITEKTIKTTKLRGSIVALEEFYPSSVSVRKIKDMPYCFWRKSLPYSTFITKYGHYKKTQLVSPKTTFGKDDQRPYYADLVDNNIPDGNVELIMLYDKLKDQFIMIANGIWINPIAGEEVMPLPWTHKELPFYEVKYDIFGDFFYGKSLPDRLKSMQDVLNVLTNMLLDQSFLSIFPPLLTSGQDPIEDDYLRPGRRTPVDTQGMSLDSSFKVLNMPTPSGWHQFILDYTRKVMEESSMDSVSQGVAGNGDRTTAYEVRQAASGVAAMLQMFARFINNAVKRKAHFKVSNIMQFGFEKDSPLIRGVLSESGDNDMKAFQSFTINGVGLTGGKRGGRLIEFYSEKAQLPDKKELQARAALTKLDSGKNFEIIAITPEYIRNYSYDISLVTNPKTDKAQKDDMALHLEKVKVLMTFFPDLIDKQELAAQTIEKMGDDPTKVLSDQALGIPPPQPPQDPMGQTVGTNPSDATSQNTVRSMMAGAGQNAQLQSMMQG